MLRLGDVEVYHYLHVCLCVCVRVCGGFRRALGKGVSLPADCALPHRLPKELYQGQGVGRGDACGAATILLRVGARVSTVCCA